MESVRTIYVGLDRALLRVDLLRERLLLAILRRPFLFLESIRWLLDGGRTLLKTEIARRSTIDVPHLPFNAELVAFLHEERAAGTRLVLATSAPHAWALAISDHLGLFDRVLATGETTGNLDGRRKLAVITQDAAGKPFGYAGDAAAAATILEASQLPVIVGGGRSAAGRQADRAVVIPPQPGVARAWLRSLRLPQWSKNLLIFLPALAAHRPELLWPNGALAFVAFSFGASALYQLNDFCDLDTDRRDPEKKNRALAAGALRPFQALLFAATLLMIAVTAAIPLPGAFDLVLLAYAVTSVLHSIALKHVPLLDLLTLAGLSTLRVIAGGAACGLPLSAWPLAFVFFLGLSLAHLKRHVELVQRLKRGSDSTPWPVYSPRALPLLKKFGHTTGLVALLVLALYASSPQAVGLYRHPALLFLVCLLLFCGLERAWFCAGRERITRDSTVFLLTDPFTYVITAATLATVWAAARY